MKRRHLLISALVPIATSVRSQSYPAKPITMITTFGGGAEQIVRLVCAKMAETLRGNIVVVSEPGASGVIAATKVARATPDGYTILVGNAGSQIYRPLLQNGIPYDTLKDFTPISQLTEPSYVVAIPPSLPVNNLQELAEYAKAHPDRASIGGAGNGNAFSLTIAQLRHFTGAPFVYIPYKDTTPSLIDTVGGRLMGCITVGTSVTRFVQKENGGLKIIATVSSNRKRGFENVVPITEQLPGFQPLRTFNGFLGPAGLPADIVNRLHTAIAMALQDPAIQEQFNTAGSVISPSSPDAFGALIRSEYTKTAELLKKAGIAPE